jgi:hypothetical protein
VKTSELLNLLAAQAEPVDRAGVRRRRALMLGAGGLGAILLTLALLGANPALGAYLAMPMFWVREAFCAALAVAGFALALRLGEPGRQAAGPVAVLALCVAAMWLLGAGVLLAAAPGQRGALLMGHTALACPWLVALVSSPVFVAAIAAMRGLAPTRLRLAGAAAGFAAGAAGALAYTLHCPETAAPFIALWYVAGMMLPTAAGALAAPALLRW